VKCLRSGCSHDGHCDKPCHDDLEDQAPQIAQLRSDLRWHETLLQLERDKVSELEGRLRTMTGSAASAAQATVTALDRLILAEGVATAVEAFMKEPAVSARRRELRASIIAWQKGKPS
jgi:hypothetical protein